MGIFRVALLIALAVMLYLDLRAPASAVFFLLALTELTRLWSRSGLWRLEGRAEVRPDRLFPGEEARLRVLLANDKPWPVFLEWRQPLPPGLAATAADGAPGDGAPGDGAPADGDPGQAPEAGGAAALPWGGRAVREIGVRAVRRGCYPLPPLRIVSRDALGFHRREKRLPGSGEVIVYPLPRLPEETVLEAADLAGERADRRLRIPDPARVVGLREYTPDTPLRFIDWKASARHGQLRARVAEPSTRPALVLAVDLDTFTGRPPDEAGFEYALSLAAGLAARAVERRLPCGLLANGARVGAEGPVILPPSRDAGQPAAILEALARLRLAPSGRLEGLFSAARLPWGLVSLFVLHGAAGAPAAPPRACRSRTFLNCAGGPGPKTGRAAEGGYGA